MPRIQKDFTFSDGRTITIQGRSLEVTFTREAIEEQAREDRTRLNGSGDPALLFFQESIYSMLAAASMGNVPNVLDAFQLPPTDWDNWRLAVAEIIPDWFRHPEYQEETIKVGGRGITVLSNRPSVLMRLFQLETEATNRQAASTPPESTEEFSLRLHAKKENFRTIAYPRMAACSTGDVPTVEQALQEIPEEDLSAWYNAARRMIPEWFVDLEEAALKNQEAAEVKKKRRRNTAK